MNERPFKICIVSVHSYPVINPRATGIFGGMETRSWGFAREIAKRPDTEVSFVVMHRSAPRRSIVDGVTVVEVTSRMDWYHQDLSEARQMWRTHQRIPATKIVELMAKFVAWTVTRPFRVGHHLRWLTPSSLLMNLNADVYVAFGLNTQSVWTAISAKAAHHPFVLCLTSDSDSDRRFFDDPDFINQYGASSAIARRLFRESDGIVVQTALQQQQVKEIWQRDFILIANPLDVVAWDADLRGLPPAETPEEPFVLWIGRADRFSKRPLEMLHVIKAYPQIPFVLVLNPTDIEVVAEINEAGCANLTVIPRVNPRQMAALMNASAVLTSTSSAAFEGIPNVLLQAAATSKPIVSLESSAEWLETSKAGVCLHGDRDGFATTIARFFAERDSTEVRQYGEAGRSYVEREHEAGQQAAKLFTYLRGIAEAKQPRALRED